MKIGGGNEAGRTYREIYLKAVFRLTSSALCPGVIRYLKDRSHDIIVVGGYSTPTGMYAIQYLRRKRIPYLLNCDGGFIGMGEPAVKRIIKAFFISGAAAYLGTGRECDKYLAYYGAELEGIHHYPFTSLHESEVLKEPVSVEEKQACRKLLGMAEEKIVLAVGSFIRRKGFDILLSAMGALDRAYGLYIVGGVETEEYRSLGEQCALTNVHFIPFMSADKLQDYYRAADLFVLPTREDIWGLVVNEAMAAGLPVITTNRCVAGLELADGCGEIVPSEDIQELAEAIGRYLKDDGLRTKAGRNALKKIQGYTIENMARTHMEIFGEVLRKNIGR